MTETYDDESNEDEQAQPNWRRKLEADAKAGREAAARAEAAEAETTQLRRQLAMQRAGIDVETPVGAMFAKAYDGEVDVDLMKAEYEKVAPAPFTPGVDQAAMQRISQAQAGGAPAGGVAPDFGAELDSIPILSPDGGYNPDYVNQVLAKTAEQAAREGRQFEVSGGNVTYQRGAHGPGPVTTEL